MADNTLAIQARRAFHRRGHADDIHDRVVIDRAFDRRSQGFVDIRDFTPDGNVRDVDVVELIEKARAAAYAEIGPEQTGSLNVYVPAGFFVVPTGKTLYFPGTGVNNFTPGLVGAGATQTIFRVQPVPDNGTIANTPFLTLGGPGDDNIDYTSSQLIQGFTILAAGGSQFGTGIRTTLSILPAYIDVTVQGFSRAGAWNAPCTGFEFLRPFFGTANHQHIYMERCQANYNQVGYRFYSCAVTQVEKCGAHGSSWIDILWDGTQLAWIGGDLQNGGNSDPNLWWGNSDIAPKSTDFRWTTGLQSGTGASLSTQSNKLSTVTGLSGLTAQSIGNWLQLTDNTPGSPDKITGVYYIDSILTSTSCKIRKGSNHSAKGSLTWQVCGAQGGNFITFSGQPYDEAPKLADFGIYRDNQSSSYYNIQDGIYANVTYVVEAAGTGSVTSGDVTYGGTSPIRAQQTIEVKTQRALELISVDDYTYPGTVSRYVSNPDQHQAGIRDSSGGRSKRVRNLVQEVGGGAMEAWDARLTTTINTSGANVQSWTGYINGTVLTPTNGGVFPQLVASDPRFSGPCVKSVGSATPALVASLNGVIPANKTPQDFPFQATVFALVRLTSTSVNDGLGNGNRMIGIQSSAGVGRWTMIQFNDGVYQANGNYGSAYGSVVGAAPQIFSTSKFETSLNTNPHAYVSSTSARNNIRISSDNYGNNWIQGAAAVVDGHPVNTSLNVTFAESAGSQPVGSIRVAFWAIFPRALTEPEQIQLIDAARAEWPLLP